MKLFLHPRWLFLATSVPQLTLLLIYYNAYQIFGSELSEELQTTWLVYGCSFLGIIIAQTLYGVWLSYHSKKLNWIWAIPTITVYTILLVSYATYANTLVPPSVPDWIQSVAQVDTFIGMFMFPVLLHAILVAAISISDNYKTPHIPDLAVLLIPLIFYAGVLLFPSLNLFFDQSNKHKDFIFVLMWSVIIISALFIIIRLILILYQSKFSKIPIVQKTSSITKVIFEILFVLVCPLIGLSLSLELKNPLGSFDNPLFFVVATVAGIILLLPSVQDSRWRLAHFVAKVLVFPYTLYFFLVFLPFTPLSVILLIFLVGILMLTPLVLFIIHIQHLYRDFNELRGLYPSSILITILVVGVGILPLIYVASTQYDKIQLHKALDYVYHSNYDENQDVPNPASVVRVLDHINNFKSRRRGDFMTIQHGMPLLDSYYNWIVLDNKTLSDKKVKLLKHVFIGKETYTSNNVWRSSSIWTSNRDFQQGSGDESVTIDSIGVESVYDQTQKMWKSQVDLVLHNQDSSDWRQSEYATFFTLPDGAFISDYYLYVFDEKVKGILAEKKTAMWVYRQIVSTRRDPGILYFAEEGTIGFRVFPFTKDEFRRTGFEILHAEPFLLELDKGKSVFLGDSTQKQAYISSYVSAQEIEKLPTTEPQFYFHFILDNSEKGGEKKEVYVNRVKQFLKTYSSKTQLAPQFTMLDAKASSLATNEWEQIYTTSSNQCGFFLERGVKQIWLENYLDKQNAVPIIVVLSDELENGIWANSLYQWERYVPQGFGFYHLTDNNKVLAHHFGHFEKKGKPIEELTFPKLKQLKKDENTYLVSAYRQNGFMLPSINKENQLNQDIESFEQLDKYAQALHLQQLSDRTMLFPKEADERWLEQVHKSFAARILTDVTSFIVLETEAQRKALLEKQKEVLTGKRILDLSDDSRRSSEPSFWILLIGMIIVLAFWKRKTSFSYRF